MQDRRGGQLHLQGGSRHEGELVIKESGVQGERRSLHKTMRTLLKIKKSDLSLERKRRRDLDKFAKRVKTVSVKTIDEISTEDIRKFRTLCFQLLKEMGIMNDLLASLDEMPSDVDSQNFI